MTAEAELNKLLTTYQLKKKTKTKNSKQKWLFYVLLVLSV